MAPDFPLNTFTSGEPPGPAPVTMSENPSPEMSPPATVTPPVKIAGTVRVSSRSIFGRILLPVERLGALVPNQRRDEDIQRANFVSIGDLTRSAAAGRFEPSR